MYAIIEDSGSQRKVQAGDVILVDLIDAGAAAVGKAVSFDRVLMIGGESAAKVGTPYVGGAKVQGEVMDPVVMGEKIHIHKHRTKKAYKKKTGHRQRYTQVKITAING
ncbi:MAG: 50S ribosomal protein L21 [Phycisphaerales bacterium]